MVVQPSRAKPTEIAPHTAAIQESAALRFEDALQGLKFVYNKGESQLRITGMFKMF